MPWWMATGRISNPTNALTLPNCAPRQRWPRMLLRSSNSGHAGLGRSMEEQPTEWGKRSTPLKEWPQLPPEGQTVKNVISDLLKATSGVISLYPRNIWGKQSWSGKTSCIKSSCSPCLCKKTFRQMEHFPSTLMSWLSKIALICSAFFPPSRSTKLFNSLFSVTGT